MVSAVEEEALGVQTLVRKEQQSNFCRPRASVDEITVEEVDMFFGGVTIPVEDLQEIEVLACIRILAIAIVCLLGQLYRECLHTLSAFVPPQS